MFDLRGKVAIVTGGNGGIGLGMARGLGAAGALVVIAARNEEKSREAAHELRKEGCRADAIECDVTDEGEVQRLMDQVASRHARLDILVNNAGTTVRKRPQDMELHEWRYVMDTNLTSAFLCCKAAYPMLRREGGKVVNVGSMLSLFGAPYAAAYGASKGGIVQFTRAIATAWAGDGIQCNAILPGWIDTELTQGAREQVPGLNERVLARTPAARWGAPSDLAGVAVFLASRESDFVTGTAIPVDGGYSIG
jgi:2-dehydro-3-deoxy-D-gluconate 5-dehydrogenase